MMYLTCVHLSHTIIHHNVWVKNYGLQLRGHQNAQKPRKDAEFNTKERAWMKISTKKELKYQPWYNDEGYQPINPKLINITVLQ